MIGRVFSRLTITALDAIRSNAKSRYWLCTCQCGTTCSVRTDHLNQGRIRSCGCLLRETTSKAKTTHGLTAGDSRGTREYLVWAGMRKRCNDPKQPCYDRYGGRGIRICDEWKNFDRFLSDMGQCPPGMTIERIDNDGPYAPENCRWATFAEQARNRRSTRMLTKDGVTLCAKDWSERVGLNPGTVRKRLNLGWTHERALTTPPLKRR